MRYQMNGRKMFYCANRRRSYSFQCPLAGKHTRSMKTEKSESYSLREIIERCSTGFARYKIPKRVVFVNEFPLSGSGKVAKLILKEEIEKQA